MIIKNTHIVEETIDNNTEFIKLHYCRSERGSAGYFKEYPNGVIVKITSDEFYKLLDD